MKLVFKFNLTGFFLLCACLAVGQKKFEGKIIYEIISTSTANGDEVQEAHKTVFFYKKNQSRFEALDNSTTIIYDYELGDQLLLMNVPDLGLKQAVLSNIPRSAQFKIEKRKEFKTILGTKCQKVVITSVINNEETESEAYADFNYRVVTGLDKSGNAIFSPLYYEYETKFTDGSKVRQTALGVYADAFNDKLFVLNYPSGYAFKDERSTFQNEAPQSFVADDKDIYMKLTTAELEEMVKTALQTEDFETASIVKEIIGKRNREKIYNTKSLEELQEMITVALGKEDFMTAEEIQEVIENRLK